MKMSGKIALALAVCVLLATPAFAEKTVKWNLAMTWNSTLTPLATPPVKWPRWSAT
jgi:hypothetical protein